MSASIRQGRPEFTANVIPAAHVQIVHPHQEPATICSSSASTSSAPPRITLIKDGDAVRAIEIVCSCGEVIRLDCQYAESITAVPGRA